MINPDDETAILTAVDAVFRPPRSSSSPNSRLTRQLAATSSRRRDFMAAEMSARGYDVDRWRIDVDDIAHLPGFSPVIGAYDDAVNVVGTRRASGQGRSLILNGHIDVVPEGPLDMWETPPYAPRIDDGWMYGRGAGDMKAGLASNLFALDAVRHIGLAPAGDVFLQSVVEEEMHRQRRARLPAARLQGRLRR